MCVLRGLSLGLTGLAFTGQMLEHASINVGVERVRSFVNHLCLTHTVFVCQSEKTFYVATFFLKKSKNKK